MPPNINPSELGRIRRLDAREVWSHEATAFTPWLQQHIDQLNEALGLEVELSGREEKVGPFAVDLYGKEIQTGHPAIIENQLEPTDHSHLGQLLTYAAGVKAGIVVWVAPKFREEHEETLKWLNEITPDGVNFFGVEIEILEINGQRAPNFKPLVQPNSWQKARSAISSVAPEVSKREAAYQKFYGKLLDGLKARMPDATSAARVSPQHWFSFAAGKTGASFSWAFGKGSRFRVELYIDTGDRQRNEAIFNALHQEGAEIEQAIGVPLDWDTLVHKRAMRISAYAPIKTSIEGSPQDLQQLQDWGVDMMIRFVKVFRPRLKALP
jgi:hypothetical protein